MHPLTTDFSAYTHEELLRMLYAGDPGTVRAVADLWRDTARAVQERGDDVRAQLAKFSPYWQGGAADQYKTMMTELVGGVGQVGERLATTRDLVYSAAEALTRAQAEAPAAVLVPPLGPAAAALSTWPSPAAAAAWDAMTEDQQLRVADELRNHESASTAADAAHADAAAVLTELAMHYLPIEDAIPHLPAPASAPEVPDDVQSASLVASQPWVDGSEPTGETGTDSAATGPDGRSLFADMYRSGSLAASSAVLGRFSLGAGWLARRRAEKLAAAAGSAGGSGAGGGSASGDGAASGGPSGASPKAGLGKGLGGAGLGGGGLGGGGLGGGLTEPATANPALTGSTAASGGSAGGAGGGSSALSSLSSSSLGGGASGARAGGMGGSMMPFMPMGGMGDGGGMNRRIPPWLVETESVFGGESVPVTPPVIGEIPDEPAGGSGWRPIG